MKTFSEIRKKHAGPSGDAVLNKKLNGIKVQIFKDKGNSFVAWVDGDRLDSFKTKQDAEKAVKAVIRELT